MDFLADESVQRILAIAGGVLGLFAVYLLLAVLSNRSVRRLATSLRRRSGGRAAAVRLQPASRLFSLPWAIGLLLVAAAALIALFVLTTGALR